MEKRKVRINITIDPIVLDSLDYFARSWGLSRSAYISMLVSDEMKKIESDYKAKAPMNYGYCEEY